MQSSPERRPRVVLATFGTHGDLHPFLALAMALRERGVEPVLAAGELYRAKVEAEGITFCAMRPDVEAVAEDLGMDERQVTRIVAAHPEFLLQKMVLPYLRQSYDDAMAVTADADLVVTHSVAYGARLAAEKRGLPWIGIVLQPMLLFSVFDPPIVANLPRLSAWIYRRGRTCTRAFLTLGKRVARRWAKPIDDLRQQIGLPPASAHPLFEGQFSDAGAIALYSPLFGPPQPDNPPNTSIVGFAFYDSENGVPTELTPQLRAFFDTGPPPIVFTQGTSAIRDADGFIRESLATIGMLKTRAVLVLDAERAQQWASHASESVFISGYAPYSQLFPRARINVHHGGAGTTAQALSAGRPQLIAPYLVDQPDNAARVVRLGAGRSLQLKHWRAERIASELNELIDNPDYVRRAESIGAQVRKEDGAAVAADLIMGKIMRK